MKAIYPKFAAISFAALLLAACSDSTSEGGSNTSPVTPTEVNSLDLTALPIDASRVDNYKDITSKAGFLFTRATEASYTEAMPEVPEEKNAANQNTAANIDGQNKQYVIQNKKELDYAKKTIKNATIFVHGGSTFKYDNTTTLENTTIVLLSSAKLVYSGDGDLVPEGCTIYCTEPINVVDVTGDINIKGNFYADFTGKSDAGKDLLTGLGKIKETSAADKAKSITPTQNITFGGKAKVYINGSIRAQKLTVAEGANVYAARNLFNAWEDDNKAKQGESTIAGNLKLGGFIKSATLDVSGNLVAGAAVKVTKAFDVNNGALVQAAYINVTDNSKTNEDGVDKVVKGDATLKLTGTGKIELEHKNVIVANNLITDNSNKGQITLKGENAVAVVKAFNFTNASTTELIDAFATTGKNSMFLFQFTNNKNNDTAVATFEDLDISASYLDYDKVNNGLSMLKLVNEEHKKYGYEWDETKLPKLQNGYKLDLIAAEKTEKSDGQSASCILPVSGNIYVCYHTNGNGVQNGNLERLTMSENGLAIAQAFEAASTDYNHLIVDGNNLLLAGSNKGGAILGQATLTSGAIGDKINLYSMTSSTKGDANCVAKYGNSYVVATTQGFSVFDQSFNNVNYTGNEGKYVVTSGSDLYTLALTNSLNKYTSADLSSAAASWTTTSAITPKDNKSVMAIDGNTMYVCKGENGIDKVDLSTGTVTQFWTCPTFIASSSSSLETGAEYTKGNCNGIAVKGDFIYVAHGTYGLVVLDKQGNMVCHRKAYTGKSANFVAVDDNYIYVAYGQSRVQVFKLTGTTKLTD